MEEDKKPFKHEMHVLSKEEVLANRCSAYEFIDFDKLEEAAERMCDHTYILTSEQGHRVIKCQKCSNIQPI